MDKDRFAAIASRGEQIKTKSAAYLWVCREQYADGTEGHQDD